MVKNLDRSFFSFVTMHAFDRQTDGRTDKILIARQRLHSMQRGKKITLCNTKKLVVLLGIAVMYYLFVYLFITPLIQHSKIQAYKTNKKYNHV